MGRREIWDGEGAEGEGKRERRDIRHPFIPPPIAAMEDMNIIRPQRWAFIPSTTPLTRMKEARRFMLRVCSNSERGMSLAGGGALVCGEGAGDEGEVEKGGRSEGGEKGRVKYQISTIRFPYPALLTRMSTTFPECCSLISSNIRLFE